ncbi:hypothetical protein [Runella sp. SP2]|uniref:hypothetical protein n=1 Tax=Runella sp. SP2 TaxID=2268026 RepID=UPI000F093D29|nr:hypothetical protein [Runella sp. SP2]AYQ31349.1 hypothetical protein DTQ70_03785 [Runella sp. SP2]
MDFEQIEDNVIKAINKRLILKIRKKGYDFDIEMEPYLEGRDFLQYGFVWGYIPFNDVYYKFYFDFIEKVTVTKTHFEPKTGLQYYFSDEEEHYAGDESIVHWRNFGRPAPSKTQD